MSLSDKTKWNKKYQALGEPACIPPDEALLKYKELLPRQGLALDLACGVGHNTLFLAKRGLNLVALDISKVGLHQLQIVAQRQGLQSRIQTLERDIDNYPLTPAHFDLIVVIRYLNRAIFAQIETALRPGGILLYKTFNHRFLERNANFNPCFSIELEELMSAFSNLEIIASNQNDVKPSSAILLARRPLESLA